MANYNLVIDTSNFKPFDITPALQVLHDYRDAYYRVEELMNKIAEEKGEYVLPESSKYKGVMDKYNADYDAVVSNFNRKNDLRTLQDVRDLRRRYHSEIAPIRTMVLNYNKYNDKIAALGADAIVGNRERALDDFYGSVNPQIEYRSSKGIQAAAAGVMLGLDNALMKAPEIAGNIAKLYHILKLQGIGGELALQQILKANPSLNTLEGAVNTNMLLSTLDNLYKQYSFEGNTPENSKVWENIVTGAIQGILAPKYSMQADQSFESAAARASREYQEEYRKFMKEQRIADMENKGYRYNKEKDTFEYDEKLARERAGIKKEEGGNSKAPYLTYNGKLYVINRSGNKKRDRLYEIYDAVTKEIVTDPSLKETLIQLYEKGASTSTSPLSGEPKKPTTPNPGNSSRATESDEVDTELKL